MRYRVGILAFLALLIAGSALSQASFEVAAIKPGDPNNRQSGVHWAAGGRVANTNATVKALIAFAYGLPEEQILGGEKWVSSDEYSIVAKPDSDSPIPSGDAGYLKMKTLFQQLLGSRFKLKVHSETRQVAVYNLILAKSGKLREADSRSGSSLPTRAGHFIGTAVPIWALAQVLSQQLARPVTDKTGLSGKYNFDLTYAVDPLQGDPFGPLTRYSPSPSDDNSPSIFTALEEQLGLRLESTRGPLQVIIIDRAEKPEAN